MYAHAGLAAPTSAGAAAAAAPAAAGGGGPGQEYTDLCLVPGGGALLAATGDARLMFYQAADVVRLSVLAGGLQFAARPRCA